MSRLHRAREKLRGRYRSRLPSSIEQLREALAGHPPDRYSVAKLAHKLRGSGGTYGFDEITDAAIALQAADEGQWATAVEALIEVCESVCQPDAESEVEKQVVVGGPRVLVVEDDTSMQEIVTAFLQTLGYLACAAGSVAEAATALGRDELGLVILDMVLPDGSGLDVIPSIPASVPTIVLTTHEDEASRQKALELGARAYLYKPFEPDAFELQLRRVVDPRLQEIAATNRAFES